jgi:hypothetical protein
MNKQEAIKKVANLEKELAELKEIINKPEDIFDVTTYSEVCRRLGEKEITLKDFKQFDDILANKLLNFAKIQQLSKYFNQGWIPNWKDSNEYKWYPYFNDSGGGFVFDYSYCHCYAFSGSVAYYKTKEISNHIGKYFPDFYKNI